VFLTAIGDRAGVARLPSFFFLAVLKARMVDFLDVLDASLFDLAPCLYFAAESSIASRARVEIRRWPRPEAYGKMGARGEE